jgi:hypothetical protein
MSYFESILNFYNSNNYDEQGNLIHNSQFNRMLLQNISNTIRNALHNLSDEIESSLMNGNYSQPNQPQYVVIKYKNMVNKKEHVNCPICFDDYVDNSMILSTQCLHFFHEDCLKKWAENNKTCPICRHDL